jgi:hypothetical protein
MHVIEVRLKSRKSHVGAAMLAIAMLSTLPARAQQDPRDLPSAKEAFITGLQKAIRENDAGWIASRIKYPARYFQNKSKALIRTPGYFKANYQTLIGPKLRAAVLAQNLNDFLDNWQGVMIGEGGTNIWAREVGEGPTARYLIVTINNDK